jgi:hypothetical protein
LMFAQATKNFEGDSIIPSLGSNPMPTIVGRRCCSATPRPAFERARRKPEATQIGMQYDLDRNARGARI